MRKPTRRPRRGPREGKHRVNVHITVEHPFSGRWAETKSTETERTHNCPGVADVQHGDLDKGLARRSAPGRKLQPARHIFKLEEVLI
jgi:hypothetical protein